MCACERDDGVDLLDANWNAEVLFAALLAASLEHAAVEQDGLAGDSKNVTRAGDFTCRAEELELHVRAGMS